MNARGGAGNLYVIKLGTNRREVIAELGDCDGWMTEGLQYPATVTDPRTGAPLPPPEQVSGAVLTGSSSMVTDREPWSERTGQWLRELVRRDIPVLGICYGHQLLAQVHGGEVGYYPRQREIGTVDIRLRPEAVEDPLMGGMPGSFPAQAIHSQGVLRLPADAVHLASGAFETNQAFRLGRRAWGVQFHPEFSPGAMRAYLRALSPELRKEGLDPDDLEAEVRASPAAASLLRRFARLVDRSGAA